MKLGLTGSLAVCLLAAGLAVGALVIRPGSEPRAAVVAGPGAGSPTAPPADSPYGGEASAPGGAGDAGGAAPAAAELVISSFAFSSVTVAPGATVTVVNQDEFPHTVTADDGSFDSGTVDGGSTVTFTAPTTPGTYQIHCDFHPQMGGTLTVG